MKYKVGDIVTLYSWDELQEINKNTGLFISCDKKIYMDECIVYGISKTSYIKMSQNLVTISYIDIGGTAFNIREPYGYTIPISFIKNFTVKLPDELFTM